MRPCDLHNIIMYQFYIADTDLYLWGGASVRYRQVGESPQMLTQSITIIEWLQKKEKTHHKSPKAKEVLNHAFHFW